MATTPASRTLILLRLTSNGDLYDAMRGRLARHLEPGELLSINAGGEYTIIVHRNVSKQPAKIMRLVKE